MLGNISVTSVWAAGPHVIYSDGRFKTNIKDDVPGLAFINELKPVTYRYNIKGLNAKLKQLATVNKKHPDDMRTGARIPETIIDPRENADIETKEKKLYTGFVAQQVEEAAKKVNYEFSGVFAPQNDQGLYGLSYADFVVPLVKAVQELSVKNFEKDKQINDLQSQVNELKSLVLKMGNTTASSSPASGYLKQNVPNPAGTNTLINYYLPANTTRAAISISDSKGRRVKIYNATEGEGQVNIRRGDLAAGTYTYTLIADGNVIETRKMILK